MSKRRHRWMYVAGAGLAVLVGLGAWGLRSAERENQQSVVAAWSQLQACMLGPTPLAAGETPSARVRNIQLTVMGIALEKRAKLGDYAWPGSCAIYGHAVSEALRNQGKTTGLAESTEKLAKASKDEHSATADLSNFIEKAWADAAGIQAVAAPDIKPPPSPVAPLNLDLLPPSAKLLAKTFSLKNVRPQMFPHPVLQFVLDQVDSGDSSIVCAASAADAKLACRKLPESVAKLSPGLRLWGTLDDGADPLLFAGDRGTAGIFRLSDGAKVAEAVTYGAQGHQDGSMTLANWTDKEHAVRMVRYPRTGVPVERVLVEEKALGNPYYTSGLFWGWYVWVGNAKNADELHLFARKLPEGEGSPGPVIDAGKIWEAGYVRQYQEEPNLLGCRTDKAIAVIVAGSGRDSVSFLVDGTWTTPVPAAQSGGQLTCHGLETAATRVSFESKQNRIWPTVTQSHCNVSSCAQGEVALETLLPGLFELAPGDAHQVQAVDVNSNLALVWQGGEAGGLRMRFGPIDRLQDVADTVVYDDLLQGGKRVMSNLLEVRVIPGEGFALLLLSTVNGVYVLRMDGKGTVTPATVAM